MGLEKIFILSFLSVLLVLPFSSGISSSNYQLNNPTISDGSNTTLASSNYALRAVVGEISSSAITSANYILKAGFWAGFIPPVPSAPSTTSSGGGAGGGGASKIFYDVDVLEKEMVFSVIIGKNETREITIINRGNDSVRARIRLAGDISNAMVVQNNIVEISRGQKKFLFDIRASERGIFTGEIIIEAGTSIIRVPVIINTKTDNFLFDASVSIPKEKKRVSEGDKIKATIGLLEVLSGTKVDVLVNYVVKDFSGNVYLEESETFFVEGNKSYSKDFSTSGLPTGDYILGIEVVYPGAYATSTSQFSVITGEEAVRKFPIQIVLIGGLAVLALVIILLLIKSRNEKLRRLRRK